MLFRMSFPRKRESSMFGFFWTPAGVYPREGGGGTVVTIAQIPRSLLRGSSFLCFDIRIFFCVLLQILPRDVTIPIVLRTHEFTSLEVPLPRREGLEPAPYLIRGEGEDNEKLRP